ncbi:MAG TPA: methyltransferase domain-containing protein [Candidatus Pacearchaeota archaeon]|nr:methyltransferase domain-containing protein [Candidatus Pacearchaeota archaeon]
MEELRYKQIGELINKLNCKSVGDFASGDEQIKNFLKKNISYKSYNYPEYNLEKYFILKENLDCAVLSEVFEHLRNPRVFIHSLSKSMRPGGKLILTTPNSGFLKNRIQLLFGVTPVAFFGPSSREVIFGLKYNGKDYHQLSDEERLKLDLMLHVRCYSYEELRAILEVEGFKIIKRMKLKYSGVNSPYSKIRIIPKIINYILPLNFQGTHFILAEKRRYIKFSKFLKNKLKP